jgi:hypothetical protein
MRGPRRPVTNLYAGGQSRPIRNRNPTSGKQGNLLSSLSKMTIGGAASKILRGVGSLNAGSIVAKGIDFIGNIITKTMDLNGVPTTHVICLGPKGQKSTPLGVNVGGDTILSFNIQPLNFEGSRLATQSELYQRYQFTSATIEYTPSVAVTTPGSLIGYFDTDPDDEAPPGSAGIEHAIAHGGTTFQVSEHATFVMPIVSQPLWTAPLDLADAGDSTKLKIQGIFNVVALTSLPSNTAIGTFRIIYNCAFSVPSAPVSSAPSQSSALFNVNGTSSPQTYAASTTPFDGYSVSPFTTLLTGSTSRWYSAESSGFGYAGIIINQPGIYGFWIHDTSPATTSSYWVTTLTSTSEAGLSATSIVTYASNASTTSRFTYVTFTVSKTSTYVPSSKMIIIPTASSALTAVIATQTTMDLIQYEIDVSSRRTRSLQDMIDRRIQVANQPKHVYRAPPPFEEEQSYIPVHKIYRN